MSEKVLLMSDIHITEAGVDIFGLNPADRFRLCLEDAIEHHADARHLFLMGDLTEHGYHDEYKVLEEMRETATEVFKVWENESIREAQRLYEIVVYKKAEDITEPEF